MLVVMEVTLSIEGGGVFHLERYCHLDKVASTTTFLDSTEMQQIHGELMSPTPLQLGTLLIPDHILSSTSRIPASHDSTVAI